MKIAVEGCCHGSLDATYGSIANLEKKNGYTVDLLLIGGDFQAIRNHADLNCMAVPQKFRQLGEFYKYYTGVAVAPVLTIVIGGNHEASNYLWELYHGGWLAPNIYYLGGAGCVNVNGVRIAGASGIFKPNHYRMGHFERVPYDSGAIRSIYHTRHYDITKLAQLSPPDIFISHDWPQGIEHHGNLPKLLSAKPFFKEDIDKGELGSPPLTELLKTLRPKRWFSAHLHVKFEATFSHEGASGAAPVLEANPDEIAIDDDDFLDDAPVDTAGENPEATVPQLGASETQFLALDKCLPRRQYLEVVDIPTDEKYSTIPPVVSAPVPVSATPTFDPIPSPPPPKAPTLPAPAESEPSSSSSAAPIDEVAPNTTAEEEPDLSAFGFTAFGKQKKPKPAGLPAKPPPVQPKPQLPPTPTQPRSTPTLTYDLEWLAISRATHSFLSLERREIPLPPPDHLREMIQAEMAWVREHVGEDSRKVDDVQKFVMTAPGATGNGRVPQHQQVPLMWYTNPQTEAFCQLIGVENKVNPVPKQSPA